VPGEFLRPYVIAEIGVNHEGSLDRAKRLIEQVAQAGGNAAKFQTYKADKLAAKHTSPAYWDLSQEPTPSQHELFQRFDSFGSSEYEALAKHCADFGIDFMSTPFDLEAVDLLTPLMPLTKIASADLTNIPLLRKVARSGNAVVLSVGAGNHEEIERALGELRNHGAQQITLLHCVLNYPTPRKHAQLGQIRVLQQRFGGQVAIGYSDHVPPEPDGSLPALIQATLFGAVVLEKHFTDDKTAVGNDHYHAMNAEDLKRFLAELEIHRELHGAGQLDLAIQQSAITNARRRIIAAQDLAAGDTITEQDLIALRSNRGIEIFNWDEVVGRRIARPVAADHPIDWEDLV
jgi:sialic acid synthase SpsE